MRLFWFVGPRYFFPRWVRVISECGELWLAPTTDSVSLSVRERKGKRNVPFTVQIYSRRLLKKQISKRVLWINLLSLLFIEIKTLCLLTCLSVARWATIISGHVVCGWATGLEASLRSHRRSRDTGKEELPVLYLCPHQHQTTAATVHNFSIAPLFSRYELTW